MPTMPIEVEMDEAELRRMNGELLDALDKRERVQAEKDEVVSRLNKSLKACDGEVHELKERLKSGRTRREVPVHFYFDYTAKLVHTVRDGVAMPEGIVGTPRAMSEEEIRGALFNRGIMDGAQKPETVAGEEPPTDEELAAIDEDLGSVMTRAGTSKRGFGEKSGWWSIKAESDLFNVELEGKTEDEARANLRAWATRRLVRDLRAAKVEAAKKGAAAADEANRAPKKPRKPRAPRVQTDVDKGMAAEGAAAAAAGGDPAPDAVS